MKQNKKEKNLVLYGIKTRRELLKEDVKYDLELNTGKHCIKVFLKDVDEDTYRQMSQFGYDETMKSGEYMFFCKDTLLKEELGYLWDYDKIIELAYNCRHDNCKALMDYIYYRDAMDTTNAREGVHILKVLQMHGVVPSYIQYRFMRYAEIREKNGIPLTSAEKIYYQKLQKKIGKDLKNRLGGGN